MKRILTWLATLILLIGLLSCEEEWDDGYETFLIPKGQHAKNFPVQLLQNEVLDFQVIFDESAIYETAIAENQWDTNKLLGFSDCNAQHHENSARFGWRWLNDQLEILAYCYVDGERIIEEMGAVPLHEPSSYRLQLTEEAYIFSINNQPAVTIDRKQNCDQGGYYMLFPYFGGDEVAPHDIRIRIKINY